MALKDIFKMIKADRYTADGCEEIKKAQEGIAEDAGLPDGSMSHRKDGDYIKQAGKWVPAKRANGGAKKADKPNPNGVVAQQKQKMETEKHEAARRDAQAPSKKTEVNTPGLRKDVQEAIKRSSPEEIKAYIKELRTPGSRMSRYFDNPDLLANVYEDELKKATESKPANKPKVPSSDSAPRVLTGDCKVRIRKETTDGGLPDGSVSHRKDGDYIKKAGKWVPAPAAKGKAGGKEKGSTAQRMKAYVDAMNKKNGEFAGKYKESKAKSDAMKQGQLAELNRASAEEKPAETSWNDARVSLKNQAGVEFFLNTVAFGMTPAWAKRHGYSESDVNGSAAENALAKKIITSQDWSKPEEAVKKLNDLDFGYNNWKVTEKQADKVKIATKDRMGNLREITITRPSPTPAASTESKPAEAPKFKSRNTIMLEKKGFKEVEKGGAYPKLHRFEYKSKSGKTYNVYRDIGSDGFFYHVQTPGGFTKKMSDVGEIKKYLDSDGGNWGHGPGPRGLMHSPYTEKDLVKSSNDAAPRQLTGDCKVRIKKS